MTTLQQIAKNFTAEFAQACADAGVANWVLDRLASTEVATPAICARWNLAAGTRDCDAFMDCHFSRTFGRLADLALKHQAAKAA